MIKRKINQAAFDALSDDLKAIYKKVGDGYTLDVDGGDDAAELKRAKDYEATEKNKALDEVKRLQAELDKTKSTGEDEVTRVQRQWQEKFEAETQRTAARLDALRDSTGRALLESETEKLATKISTVPSLMAKAIKERVTVEFDDKENPVLRILGDDGKVNTALSMADLEKDLVANKDYSSIIIGSKATGSSASKTTGQNGGSATSDLGGKPTPFSRMSVKEQVAHLKHKKELEQQNEG